MGRRKMHIGIWWVNVQGTDYVEDLDTDGSLTLKLTFKIYDGIAQAGLFWFRKGKNGRLL
jgi:hypothetical protein